MPSQNQSWSRSALISVNGSTAIETRLPDPDADVPSAIGPLAPVPAVLSTSARPFSNPSSSRSSRSGSRSHTDQVPRAPSRVATRPSRFSMSNAARASSTRPSWPAAAAYASAIVGVCDAFIRLVSARACSYSLSR